MNTRTASADKIIFSIIGGFTILILIAIGIFSVFEGKKVQSSAQVNSYTANDSEKPQIIVGEKFSDLGVMNVRDEKKAEFRIENKGNKPLQLFGVSSSCDCTYGQITIAGAKSPEFSMHSKNTWVGSVDPGIIATVTVIYRPFVMPVKGTVTRDVYVSTNDPQNPKLTFTVKAYVQ